MKVSKFIEDLKMQLPLIAIENMLHDKSYENVEDVFEQLSKHGIKVRTKVYNRGGYKYDDETFESDLELLIEFKNKGSFEIKKHTQNKQLLHFLQETDKIAVTCDEHRTKYYDGINFYDMYSENFWVMDKIDEAKSFEDDWVERVKLTNEICKEFGYDAKTLRYDTMLIAKQIMHDILEPFDANHVSFDEDAILSEATRGGFMYANKGKIVNDYTSYDLNSAYSSAMIDSSFSFPLHRGEITKIEKMSKKHMLHGCYRGDVSGWEALKNSDAVFKSNASKWYHSYDIQSMKNIGLKFSLIHDEQPNALMYERTTDGNTLYGVTVRKLYALKMKGNKLSKRVLTCLWGLHGKQSTISIKNSTLDEKTDKEYEALRKRLVKCHENGWTVRSEFRPFEFSCGRFKISLLSFARKELCRITNDLVNAGFDIARVNTDSILTNAKRKDIETIIPIGEELGKMKIEKVYLNHIVNHVNSITEVETTD